MTIPAFTVGRCLPPYVGPDPTNSAVMSPYTTTLTAIADRMAGSDARKEILRGLLIYRQRLNNIGLNRGFQWLSGSFMEDVETLEKRDPRDVDIVTFVHRPLSIRSIADLRALVIGNAALFDHAQVKAAFKCDNRFIDLDEDPSSIVSQARFWFGLFSHRRSGVWKGMLQVSLAVTPDDAAAAAKVAP